MMKRSILFFFVVLLVGACGETKPEIDPNDLKNPKTDKHVRVPGTRLYLVSPLGFTYLPGGSVLKRDDYTAIQVMDLPGGNFYSNAATFNKEAFVKQGATVFEYRELKINGYPAKFIGMQSTGTKGYSLVFGDSSFSTMVMAMYPPGDTAAGRNIKTSLLSFYYDTAYVIDPFETALFKLEDQYSMFKFAKGASNMYVYTIGGIDNKDTPDDPFMSATMMPVDATVTPESVFQEMLRGLARNGFVQTTAKNGFSGKTNGNTSYEGEVYGKMGETDCVVYLLVVSNDKCAVVLQGIAKSDYEMNVVEFKKLSHTIKLK